MQTTTSGERGCLSSKILPPDDPEIEAFLAQGISIPPGPRCSVCGHQMCPCCRTSCDQLVWFDFFGAPITDPNDPRELVDFECCCAGRCVVDLEDVQYWYAQIAELVSRAELESRPTLQQHGPFWPGPDGRRFEIPCDGQRHDTRHLPPNGEWGVVDLRS